TRPSRAAARPIPVRAQTSDLASATATVEPISLASRGKSHEYFSRVRGPDWAPQPVGPAPAQTIDRLRKALSSGEFRNSRVVPIFFHGPVPSRVRGSPSSWRGASGRVPQPIGKRPGSYVRRGPPRARRQAPRTGPPTRR